MNGKQRLELTWIGKNERPRLEPRILLEDLERSYRATDGARSNDAIFDNVLIHGDNLLALKALEFEFSGKVQCIYIDPPFNTGEAFDHYEDGLEHSLWLTLMYQRLVMLRQLLHPSGTIFIHIDDNELAYLTVLADEVLGRSNRISLISFKQSSVSGPKSRNPGVVSIGNYILVYAADKKQWKNINTYRAVSRDSRYSQFIRNFDAPYEQWQFMPLTQAIAAEAGIPFRDWEEKVGKNFEREMEKFVLTNAHRVVQMVSVADADVNADAREQLARSREEDLVCRSPRENAEDYYFYKGKQIAFYSNKAREIDGVYVTAERVSNIWDDLLSNNVHKEGGVSLPNGKKPEALIKRCLEISTEKGDLVLDSFLGSGTTAAVAHKMGRRWIGVELGEQAHTHCQPRLRRVVDGVDLDGITAATGWKGGGGFRYFRLAPSLIKKDDWGNEVISPEYNAAMLAEAMCKHMGFIYAPNPDVFWQHGRSTERDFIYVTTAALTHEQLKKISDLVGPERTLLICCRAFQGKRVKQLPNLTVVKIPQAVLTRCEWGKDDYSQGLFKELPVTDPPEDDAPEEPAPRKRKKRAKAEPPPALFDDEEEEAS